MKNKILGGLFLGFLFLLFLNPLQSAFAQDNKFIFAAQFDDVKSLSALINTGINPNEGDVARGETALMWCIRENSVRAFDYLLQLPQVDLNTHAKNGDTALMLASYLNKNDFAQKLIKAGASINHEGWTALHYAAVVGNVEVMELLLNNGAKVNALSPNKTTPLMMATRSGRVEIVELLILHGADVKLKNDLGMTAYDFAIQSEKLKVAEFLEALQK